MTAMLRSAAVHLRTPLYLNAYALMLSNLLTSALGLVYWTLAARLYPVEVIGTSSALISTMLFVTGVSQLNLRVALNRLVPEAGRDTPRLVAAAYGVTLAVTAVVATLVFTVVAVGAPGGLLDRGPAPLVVGGLVVATMTWTIFNLQDGILSGLRRAVWVPVENALYSVAKVILLLILALTVPTHGILTSFFLPMVVAVVIVSVVLARRWIPSHVGASPGRSLGMTGPRLARFIASDYVASLFALAASALLPIFVVTQLGSEQGAYFYIVWTIVASLQLIPVNMAASLTAETVAASGDRTDAFRRVFWHLARILVPIVAVIVVAGPLLLEIFGRAYAVNGSDALRLLAVSVLPHAVTVLYLAEARVEGRARAIVVVQAVVAVLTLSLVAVLVGRLGISGVALGWLVAQGAVALVLLATRMRHVLRPGVAR
jgi:O-antigen/teichoic acid export membrane protein